MRTRVTSTTTDSLTWDEFGRLVSVKRVVSGQSPATTTFAYGGFGRRIRKATSATTVHYLWDGDQIVAELNGSGVVRKTYTYYPGIDQPRSVTTGGETYFMSTEPDGTVNGLIRKSDREVVAQFTYTPWGELETASQSVNGAINRLRWKGLPYDPESGFYYMRARYYDPKIRRFVAEDPIGLAGGINVYAFGAGDPVNRNDPWGLDPQGNGFNQCWKWDYSVTWGNSEPIMYWVQVECPSSPLPSLSQGLGQGQPYGPTGQTTGGGSVGAAPGPTSPSIGPRSPRSFSKCTAAGIDAAAATGMDLVSLTGVGLVATRATRGAAIGMKALRASQWLAQNRALRSFSPNSVRSISGWSANLLTDVAWGRASALAQGEPLFDAKDELLSLIPIVNASRKISKAIEACW